MHNSEVSFLFNFKSCWLKYQKDRGRTQTYQHEQIDQFFALNFKNVQPLNNKQTVFSPIFFAKPDLELFFFFCVVGRFSQNPDFRRAIC